MLEEKSALVIGAGDLATGIIRRLHLAGAKVVATELETPLTVRRFVSLSEAVHSGTHTVEGVTGRLTSHGDIDSVLEGCEIPIVVDPRTSILGKRAFDVVIDGRLAKKNLGIRMSDAKIVIGVGPGFTAGEDCHAVIETLQGGGMGRAIFEGPAACDTGEPCALNLPGAAPNPSLAPESRVLRAPVDGVLRGSRAIGDRVDPGDIIAEVDGIPVKATLDGVLRGLVHDGLTVKKGLKIGEVDLTGKVKRCHLVSEKANAVAGGVLEACFVLLSRRESPGGTRHESGAA
ncbi:MAG: selenium-dependent molybdenum cofactor biosynthesis protein YqeB [Planctomycetota bacterium]|jgi:xanthine dehydrogenase accessory factor